MNSNAILESALAYGRRGWRVVANRARDKKPWQKKWPQQATTDETTILQVWGQRPDSNVGIACVPKDAQCTRP